VLVHRGAGSTPPETLASREATATGVATRVVSVAEIHQRVALADDVRVAPKPDVGLDALLRHRQPQLGERRRSSPGGRLIWRIRGAPGHMASAARSARYRWVTDYSLWNDANA
jgi:hypothetical protein